VRTTKKGQAICLLVLALLLPGPLAAADTAARPNIVYFLADDLGYNDVGWHGKEIRTPHLDRLAHAGARLEQFYVQPLCSPTRAALLTGRYPMRYGLQVGVVRPWARYGLPLEERTLAQALQEAGYRTALVGKWHLGHFRPDYLPTRRGFDLQYGHYNGAIDYFTHLREGGFDWHRNDRVCRDEGYTTHLIAREAVRLVREHDAKKPLFLYVPFNAPHAPHQVPAKYKTPYAALKEPRRSYAGMVAALDEAVGQIALAIEKKGLTKQTLFLFSSDNGGPAPGQVTDNGRLRGAKGGLYEGGVRVPAFATWQGRIKAGTVVQAPLHVVDWYPTLLKLAGATLEQKLPLDGKDAWPTITQGKPSPHDVLLLNAAPGGAALRAGDWKLLVGAPQSAAARGAGKGKKDQVQLYNLADDPGEKKDLAAAQPAKVKELRARYDALARQAVQPKVRPRAKDFRVPKVWGEE
jgi:arylsulfatase A-like enzyme